MPGTELKCVGIASKDFPSLGDSSLASQTPPHGGRRIACWSGPRNISTAMMRSWDARSDTFVCDEPLYAHFLINNGLDHPVRQEILDHHDSDAERVVAWLTDEIPEGGTVWYQKHMAHHLIGSVPRGWLDDLDHAFLIRDPKDMLTSLMQILPKPDLLATGLPQQAEIFERVVRRTGKTPPVCDARDVLDDPRGMLTKLCAALDIEFTDAMLSWAPGRRPTDGVWAPEWYSAVEKSTSFMRYTAKDVDVPDFLREVLAEAQILYDQLAQHRIGNSQW